MRFADADVLPYDFIDFAETMHRYVAEVKKLLADKQEEIRDRNEAIDQHLYDAASDPRRPLLRRLDWRCLRFSILLLSIMLLLRSIRSRNGTPKRSTPSPTRTTGRALRTWLL